MQEGHGQRKKHVEIVNVGVWEQLCGSHWFMEGEERTLACGGCRKGVVEGMIPGEVERDIPEVEVAIEYYV